MVTPENNNPDKNPPVPLAPAPKVDQKKEDEAVANLPDGPDENLPKIHEVEEVEPLASEYKGLYLCKRDQLQYALAIKAIDVRGRTYCARNKARFWQGTRAEFEDQFVKV